MKIVIIGHKNHGKGTFANILREFGLTCMGTSQFEFNRAGFGELRCTRTSLISIPERVSILALR